MSSFSGSYRSCKPLSSSPRPTRMHEILDVDTSQPFEFEGERYYLDEAGFVRHRCVKWSDYEVNIIERLEDSDILTAIINNPNSVHRSRLVDYVGIMEHLRALGMRYILEDSFKGSHYVFKAKTENITYEDLFNFPDGVLKNVCDLYIPKGSSLSQDISGIMCAVPMADMVWSGDSYPKYAIDIDEYLRVHRDTEPFYRWS